MRYSLRVQKLYFTFATVTCFACAAAVIAWGVRSGEPIPALGPTEAEQLGKVSDTNSAARLEPTREDFAKLWDRPLRRVLYDPPPPKPEVRQLPPLRVEVLGTIIEGENSMAMVRTEQGKVEYKRVGDNVGPTDSPASVVEIGANEVVLKRAEERITLGVQTTERR